MTELPRRLEEALPGEPARPTTAELQGWRAGDPCGSCGSTETTDEPGDGAYCLSCGASDIESEAWVDLRV